MEYLRRAASGKRSSEKFRKIFKTGATKFSSNITGKHLCQSLVFNKVKRLLV